MSLSDHLKAVLTGVEIIAPEDEPLPYTLEMASIDIYNLLKVHFPDGASDRVYPGSTKESRIYPDAVFNIASGPVQKMYKNTPIAYTTLYDVVIREKSHADLMTLVASVESAIEGSPGIQRVDAADDYLEEENAYRMGLNIEISQPVCADLTEVPEKSVIVASGSWSAEDGGFDNCLRQRVTTKYHLISTATTKADLKTLRDELRNSVLGWRENIQDTKTQAVKGDDLQADAGLYTAVDIYASQHWITD